MEIKKLKFNKNHNKWFLSKITSLIKRYNLISKGEKIGLALSGGMDSVTLLYILAYLKKFSSMDFSITAIHIKTGDYDTKIMKKFCSNLNVKYNEFVLPKLSAENNKCYYCSKGKRIILKKEFANLGIKKVIFAHNKNDVTETFFMNLVLHKRIETIKPISSSADFTVIRPMLDLDKRTIEWLHKYFNLPLLNYECPHQTLNKRQYFRDWINRDDEVVQKVVENITSAFGNSGIW